MTDNKKYSIAKFDFGEYRTRFQLTIAEFTEDDVGLYKCICKNTYSGKVEGNVRLALIPGMQYICVRIVVSMEMIIYNIYLYNICNQNE